jgi:uncharacterized protein YkwD
MWWPTPSSWTALARAHASHCRPTLRLSRGTARANLGALCVAAILLVGAFPTVLRTPQPAVAALDVASAEALFFALVNEDRAAYGLPPLAKDERLMALARWRSADMVNRDYYSHTIPGRSCYRNLCYEQGGDVFRVVNDLRIAWLVVSENITWPGGPDERVALNAEYSLMHSASHRAAILDPDHTHLGVGIAQGADGRTLFTQLFIQAPADAVPAATPKSTVRPAATVTPAPSPPAGSASTVVR